MTAPARASQRGAALLLAMLILALIATLASAMVWQQWRAVQVEAAERARTQAAWILIGALDWSRLILREDKAGFDHLGEPWAVPLAEARLSSFLAAGKDGISNSDSAGDDGLDAFLSGQITDAQSRYNLNNLVVGGKAVPAEVRLLRRLFETLGVAPEVATTITVGLRDAGGGSARDGSQTGGTPGGATGATPGGTIGGSSGGTSGNPNPTPGATNPSGDGSGTNPNSGNTDAEAEAALNLPAVSADPPLLPQSLRQLRWLGLDEDTLARIAPHVTLVPRRTTVNLNTASRELIAAAIDKLDLAGAQNLVQARERKPFETLADAEAVLGQGFKPDPSRVGVATDYFEVRGRLRLGDRVLEERSLVWRNQREVQTVSRERVNIQDKLP